MGNFILFIVKFKNTMKAIIALFLSSVAADDESFIKCSSNKDCPNGASYNNGMFNGTCCGRTEWVNMDPYKLGGDWTKTADF